MDKSPLPVVFLIVKGQNQGHGSYSISEEPCWTGDVVNVIVRIVLGLGEGVSMCGVPKKIILNTTERGKC